MTNENDRMLADDIADHRVMTPTEVGEIVRKKTASKPISLTWQRTSKLPIRG